MPKSTVTEVTPKDLDSLLSKESKVKTARTHAFIGYKLALPQVAEICKRYGITYEENVTPDADVMLDILRYTNKLHVLSNVPAIAEAILAFYKQQEELAKEANAKAKK